MSIDNTPPPVPQTGYSLPHIGAYWYGPKLGPLERSSLYSMLQQGHEVTLFSHENVDRVPEGVEIRDAREITGDRTVIEYLRDAHRPNRTPTPALFSDLFRYHMISQVGWVWLDLDCFLLQPLRVPSHGYLFVRFPREFAWGYQINGAVLSLPQSSSTLQDLLEFCQNEYPIPPFYPVRWKVKLRFMKVIRRPIHVSYQKWGVWGPLALSYFLRKNRREELAQESKLFYPILMGDDQSWRNGQHPFLLPSDQVKESYLQDAISVNLDSAVMNRRLKEMNHDLIPKGSYLEEIINIGKK